MKKRDYTAIWGLINATRGVLEAEEAKEIAVSEVSGGRTTSLRELSDRELTLLRVRLRAQARSLAPSKDKTRTRRRSMCLHLMEEYGIDTHDWNRINAFVEDPRIAGKPFGRLTSEELSALSRKLRAMIRKLGIRNEELGITRPAPSPHATPTPLRGKYYLLTREGTVKTSNSNIN